MQQTQKYKLNLIEPSDPFLPDALNANTQKVEDVLKEKMEGSLDAMDQRVTVLEGKKFACGFWTGGAGIVNLGFRPRAVVTQATTASGPVIYVENTTYSGNGDTVALTDNGFQTRSGGYFYFLAFS